MPGSTNQPIRNKIKETIKRYALLRKGDKIVIAVSGGPDSVALLYLLNSFRKDFRLTLHIAHLDHRLRSNSLKDKEFVENLACKLSLPITCAQINPRALSIKGSLEEIARNLRLDFLFKVAKKIKADKVALGHNLDDQAETVLMRILRGTGLFGLSGMLPKREISGCEVIRPLIETKRKEIERYLKRKKIKARIDRSNFQDLYFRNRIRNQLIPLLENKYNKNIKIILSNLANIASYDYDYLIRAAVRKMDKSHKSIRLDRYSGLHPAMQRLVLRLNIARIKGDTRRVTFKHIQELEDLISNRPLNSIVDLPKGVSVVKKKNSLSFYRRKA
ncbi:MAG: tRNA lysidine(34) synthetase TilS [Candidatus Omnitrophota bacterium]